MSSPDPRDTRLSLKSLLAMLRPGPGGGPLDVVRRLGWGVSDQAMSSLSNFVLGIVVAKSLGAADFGAFSLAYVTYGVIINASRGLATDPLVVRFSGKETPAWRKAVADSSATAAAVGLITGVACIVVGLVVPNQEVKQAFLALGFGLPGLMLQDSWRFAFFAVGKGNKALLNDLVWSVLLIGALVGLLVSGHRNVFLCMLAFGATATIAAGFGVLQTGIVPRPSGVIHWVVDHHALGTRYLVENVSIGAARQVRMFVLGAAAGLASVGYVRAAEILMGPFLVVLMGVSQVAVPEASHVLKRAPRKLARFCFGLGAVEAVAAAVWGVVILALLPLGLGDLLLGPKLWPQAAALLTPVNIGMALACFSTGAAAGVRALGAAPRSLRAQLISSVLYVLGGGLGAYYWGAAGSCWGVAIATTIAAFVWWAQLRRGLAEHLTATGVGGAPGQPDRIPT